MVEIGSEDEDKIWKIFLRRHWKMFAVFIAIAIVAIIGAISVFRWFVGDAISTGLVPELLGEWSIGYLVTFLLNLLYWEILYIGIPVLIVVVLIIFLWWKKLPKEERKEYRKGHLFFGKSSKSDFGGGISFLVFIFFIIKVWLDGNWGLKFGTWEFEYLISTWITALIWVLIIFAIPIGLGIIWWIHSQLKK
jgi:hypothetical protein